ncbi:hypothetical protein BCR35DRAFT_351319 [Leucosporidium creatinivorum]|uniref:Uncharacterized protein n=1 Tax=Leucosporidium creatinivorum TaxID=106004 RepID=A0A1Y2FXL3_9BASI|nr:hypothetical protein BCR35DRAFT_351319 [Leucosporidium creatinivorum]
MPPLRLPKKGKAKAKAAPIDFTSLQTALQSQLDFDGWIEEGVQQEEQGERYQFGTKAQRHYTNAVIAFRCAASLNPTSFDALYNSARITQQLASDHLAAPECYNALEEAVASYRQALTLATTEEERIDALFNLAQACVELQEMGDAGATGKKEASRLMEARELFAEVERLQTAAMEKVFGSGSSGGEEEDDEGMDEAEGSRAGSEAGVQMGEATEGRIVTPQLVLDTILEGFEVDLALYSTPSIDAESLTTLASSAHAALQRAFTLRQQHLAASSPAVDLSLSLAQLSFSSTCSSHLPSTAPLLLTPEAQRALYTTLLPLHPRNPSLLSSYADHLLDSLPLTPDASSTLQQATTAYTTVYALLCDRFTPQKDLPAHAVPALLSSNLVARSSLLLLQDHLDNPTPTTLLEAQKLALEAVAITGSGVTISLDSAGGLSAKATAGRKDWSTIKALREAWFQLVRIRLRVDGAEGQARALGEAWGKATGRSVSVDLQWCVDEVYRDDKVWEASQGAEEALWRGLVGV